MDKFTKIITPVLICGGSGKRLWPLSRAKHPKQLLKLYNAKTLLQNTVLRCASIDLLKDPIIICNEENQFIMTSQLNEIHASINALILEPGSYNTAPVAAIAALYVLANLGDELLIITPVDHKIEDIDGLTNSLNIAVPYALEEKMVIFGVTPTTSNTQYGYIEVESMIDDNCYVVRSFKEKPDEKSAKKFLQSGKHFWNSGMYLVKASRLLADFEHFQPALLETCRAALSNARYESKLVKLSPKAYAACKSISLDYAISEKAKNIFMVKLLSPWSDIGNWTLLRDVDHKDGNGNVVHGNALTIDTEDSYVHAEEKLVVALGLRDCFIIDTRDALLVVEKKSLDKIPAVVESLKQTHRTEADIPAKVHRPWGYYIMIEKATNYQIKKIVVFPQQKLSLQEHQYRSEHWVILKGKATITLGHEQHILKPNESIFVPIGIRHRIANMEVSHLELIEVQMGSYLGEDDIKRYDDIYHRDH